MYPCFACFGFSSRNCSRWRASVEEAFVKNAGLGFAIPYLRNGQPHDYIPDFIIRLKREPKLHLVLEAKGYDELEEVKSQAAHRWVNAVNADGSYGQWRYVICRKPGEVGSKLGEMP